MACGGYCSHWQICFNAVVMVNSKERKKNEFLISVVSAQCDQWGQRDWTDYITLSIQPVGTHTFCGLSAFQLRSNDFLFLSVQSCAAYGVNITGVQPEGPKVVSS